jgi:heme exporter protein D
MMLAQVNQFGVAPEQVGVWLGCALGVIAGVVLVLSGINQWRRLMRPARKRRDGFITRGEHEQSEHRIFARLDRHELE